MAQILSPISDITVGTWRDNGGGSTNIYLAVDEVSFNDSDYISTTSSDTYECRLAVATDPKTNVDHIFRVRFRSDGSAAPERLNIDLVQGTTIIASLNNNTNRDTAFIEVNYTLLSTEADSITDYSNLRIRVTSSLGGGEEMFVSWIQFECPEPSGKRRIVISD